MLNRWNFLKTGFYERIKYSALVCQIIEEEPDYETRAASLVELGTLSVRSQLAEPLLKTLASHETDQEWKQDLTSAGSDWISRVLTVNLKVDSLVKTRFEEVPAI